MNYTKIQAAFETRNCEAVEPANLEELEVVLTRHEIAYQDWGQGATKTPADLLAELDCGESRLVELTDRSALGRILCVAAIDVFATVNNQHFKLREQRQIFRNGAERTRSIETSLSEKIMGNESPESAALRGLAEELQISYGGVLRGSESRLAIKPSSESYPGLLSVYHIHPFEAHLSLAEYKPKGYKEKQPDKTTLFTWHPVT